jgi:PAS domain S-box-containing protein
MQQIINFLNDIFAVDQWPARWFCGNWSDFHGWLYIISSFAIWGAYFTIPIIIAWFISKKKDLPFKKIFILFISFILFCGFTHLLDGLIFWFPVYRFSALILFFTAIVSWGTVIAFYKVMPEILSLKTPTDFKIEIDKIKEDLELKNKRFQFLADNMPQLVFTATDDGNFDYFNEKTFQYTGLRFQDLKDDKWFKVIHPEDKMENEKKWTDSVKTGKDFIFEQRILNVKGEYRWHLTRATAERNENGQITSWITTCTDIHANKKESQRKDDFIGIVSHELKTPLTIIKAYTGLLELELETKENASTENTYVNKIKTSINKLERLINDLLDIAIINSGKLKLKKEKICMKELLDEFTYINSKNTVSHAIIYNCTSPNNHILGDQLRIEQVMSNYLNNAIKYSPHTSNIIVELNQNEKEIIVSVEDFGIGFPEGSKHNLFNKYYRSASPVQVSGMGIGLFICKEIINKHKGKVWAERKREKGSIFYFSLPIYNEDI